MQFLWWRWFGGKNQYYSTNDRDRYPTKTNLTDKSHTNLKITRLFWDHWLKPKRIQKDPKGPWPFYRTPDNCVLSNTFLQIVYILYSLSHSQPHIRAAKVVFFLIQILIDPFEHVRSRMFETQTPFTIVWGVCCYNDHIYIFLYSKRICVFRGYLANLTIKFNC